MAHIRLNTHPSQGGQAAPPVIWGARDPKIRGRDCRRFRVARSYRLLKGLLPSPVVTLLNQHCSETAPSEWCMFRIARLDCSLICALCVFVVTALT